MAYAIVVADSAARELRAMRAFDRARVTAQIRQNLGLQPTAAARNRKELKGVEPDFDHVSPVWELRIGDIRVFYDVDEPAALVNIRSVRRKPPGATTEEIIHERSDN